jgi:FtsH-binding integral membrane protein
MTYSSFSKNVGATTGYNQGLRNFFLSTYRAVTLNLGITFLVSFILYYILAPQQAFLVSLVGCIGSFVMILYMSFRLRSISAESYKKSFYLFSFFEGLGLIGIYYMYTFESIISILLLTVSLFGALSIVGGAYSIVGGAGSVVVGGLVSSNASTTQPSPMRKISILRTA